MLPMRPALCPRPVRLAGVSALVRLAATAALVAALASCTETDATGGVAPGTAGTTGATSGAKTGSGAAGSSPATGAAGGATPNPAPSVAVTASKLEGTWVFGDKNEPGAGAVTGCQPDQSLVLQRVTDGYHGSVTTCAGPCLLLEQVDGDMVGGTLQLSGSYKGNLDPNASDVSYALTFNAATQHLVGTRNGRPFWAAPFVLKTDGSCDKAVR